jgi:hypothetical protein
LRRNDRRGAAQELRTGAAYLEQEAKRAPAESKTLLTTSAQELTQLATRLQEQGVASEQELSAAFERAHQARATHFQLQAGFMHQFR